MAEQKLKVVVATPLEQDLCSLIVNREPRIDLVVDQQLLPPMRWQGDHEGDPTFKRTAGQQEKFERLLIEGEAFYGIPDTNPALLGQIVPRASKLRWIHTMAAGGGGQIKAANLSAADLERVLVTTSAGPHSATLAEFAVFGVLAGAKNLPRLRADQEMRTWPDRWFMKHLSNMTVCVVGLGSIGQACARYFSALGARVIGVNRSIKDVAGVEKVYLAKDIVAAAAEADAIVNTAPGTDATLNLINAEVFAAARPGLIVSNVGRGTVIEEQALIAALRDGQVGYAALDVFAAEPLAPDSPLWSMSNVLVSPHTAALDAAEDRLIAELFAENATAILDGKAPKNVLNTVDFY